jgi:hypothetical protein
MCGLAIFGGAASPCACRRRRSLGRGTGSPRGSCFIRAVRLAMATQSIPVTNASSMQLIRPRWSRAATAPAAPRTGAPKDKEAVFLRRRFGTGCGSGASNGVSRRVGEVRSIMSHTVGRRTGRSPHAGRMPALEPLNHRPGVPRLGEAGSFQANAAWGGSRAGAKVAGSAASPSADTTLRARVVSTMNAVPVRRPPHGQARTSWAKTRRSRSALGSQR